MPVGLLLGVLSGVFIPEIVIPANESIPYFIALMLLTTYSKLDFKEIKVSRMPVFMIVFQYAVAILSYLALYFWNPLFAQQAFICLICPVATSAPVIALMLGANIAVLVSFTLISYVAIAILAPFLLPIVGGTQGVHFLATSWMIARQIIPLILLPLIVAYLFKNYLPKADSFLQKHHGISFYLWSITLVLVIGKATTFVLEQPSDMIPVEIGLAAISLVACVFQFVAGHAIGARFGNKVAGTQGLGQKNTAIAMWLAFEYLNPLVSVGLAAYSVWQNIINSTQIYLKGRS
jgi:BASS family bile acid:Na+ symporter